MSASGRPTQPPAEAAGRDHLGDLTDEELGRHVQDALVHLHDPVYLQTHPLARLVADQAGSGNLRLGRALRRCLLEAVEALRPEESTEASVRRGYDVLRLRYVEALDVPAVEDRLGLSRRQCQREHQRALAAVVSILRERWRAPRTRRQVPDVEAEPPVERVEVDSGLTTSTVAPLPIPLSSFVGRDREVGDARALLRASRLLTLTGMGGSGKTRLALEVASRLSREEPEAYPDGVVFVELASLSEPGLVPRAVAFGLGLREPSGGPVLASLIGYLRSKRLLIVLDNCEHLLLASARLAESLLRACSELRILATSREALGIGGETRYRVPLLGVPSPEQWSDASMVSEYESVRLFVERARAVRPDFALGAENASSVGEICWQLDGIPLAIELAAARVRMLSPEQIARRLDDRFHLLTDGSRTAEPRQQTLKSALDWSHDLLSEPEKALSRRLAVFAGGFSLEAAEEICAGDGIQPDEVLALLGQLVDRSFVVVDEARGELRYRLLETVRQYAEGRLAEAGESHSLRERHFRYFLGQAERLEPAIWAGRDDQRSLANRIEADQSNLRAAISWGLRASPTIAVRMLVSLWSCWYQRGFVPDRAHWTGMLLDRARDPAVAPTALYSAAVLALGDHDPDRMLAYAERAIEAADGAADRSVLGAAWMLLGVAAGRRGEAERARQALSNSLAYHRAVEDRKGIADACYNLGLLERSVGDYPTARAWFEEALPLHRELGDWRYVIPVLGAHARTAWYEGDYAGAWSLMEQSLAVSQKVGIWFHTVLALAPLLAWDAGDRARAWELVRKGLDLFQRARLDNVLPQTLCITGSLLIDEGAHAAGVRLIGAALPLTTPPDPIDRADEARVARESLKRARAALGEEAFARAWAEGKAMTLDQAVAYALGDEV